MARKSRKNVPAAVTGISGSPAAQTVMESKQKAGLYQAAIYARLSYETEANRERDTIETQIAYIRNFIEEQDDMVETEVYADVSVTGTTFERPEFERMMQDMKSGKINTVITKDLSRLGRNYIDAGTYIERIFPLFHVRYIALNDDFDTERAGTDLTMPLKNIVNEWYVKDLSGKMCSSYRAIWNSGGFIYRQAPYGYEKDKEAKRLVVDKETAPVVKRIFNLYLEGMTFSQIARLMKQEEIVSPPRYRFLKLGQSQKVEKARDWYHLQVKTILKNRHYVGDSVHATREGGFKNPNKDRRLPEEQWLVIPDTHEPIVSREIFEKVQEKIKEQTRKCHEQRQSGQKENAPANFFRGKCVCAGCGKNIGITRNNSGKSSFSYRCTTNMTNQNIRCLAHGRMKYEKLHEIVFQVIRSHMKLCLENTERVKQRNRSSYGMDRYKFYAGEISRIQNSIRRIKSREGGLYEDYRDGIITGEEYLQYQKSYKQQLEDMDWQAEELLKRQRCYEKDFVLDEEWLELVKKFSRKRKLTKEMADAFVEKIVLDHRHHVEIVLKYDDFLKELMELAEEGKEEAVGSDKH